MLQSLSVLADAGRVGTTSRLEPINLKILRRTRVMPFSFLVLSAAALWIAGLVSSGELRFRLLGLAVIPTAYAVIAVKSRGSSPAKKGDGCGSTTKA